jgi:hypothetical protein
MINYLTIKLYNNKYIELNVNQYLVLVILALIFLITPK